MGNTIARELITGLVLAGGRGSRMGGVDKGLQDHLGKPLALQAPWLVTVPCDTPNFPPDLVARLAAAAAAGDAELAIAATREGGVIQPQPVFCLMRAALLDSLLRFTQSGQRKIDRWTTQQRCVTAVFDAAEAFANANTVDELQRLQAR